MLPKPYTVPTQGPSGRYLEAIGQHPWRPAHIHFKVTAPGHRKLVTQVFFPGDPVPGERHHRRGQAGARAAGRAGERPPHVHVRHRAGPTVSLTFDNLGEVADLERGRWPADAPLGRHASVTRTLPRMLELLAAAEVRATFFVEGLNAELYPDALRSIADAGHEVAFHGWQHEQWADLSPQRGARVVRARRDRSGRRSGSGPSASGRRAAS